MCKTVIHGLFYNEFEQGFLKILGLRVSIIQHSTDRNNELFLEDSAMANLKVILRFGGWSTIPCTKLNPQSKINGSHMINCSKMAYILKICCLVFAEDPEAIEVANNNIQIWTQHVWNP